MIQLRSGALASHLTPPQLNGIAECGCVRSSCCRVLQKIHSTERENSIFQANTLLGTCVAFNCIIPATACCNQENELGHYGN
ncbi:hypothetical protein TNIN_380741 [Trichonephila inaurata madagascariensis]|uniref:Hydrophobin n=1 Tax=Trichonephila inaurata madagascariensis TaxID=2747483 RepID=A0A8X6XGF9_9ARAC|nr:hypothetical protein TNIN_380741 [Trichonephila inaurata madagascariensis]